MAHSLTALARVESAIGRTEEAQAHGRESLEICRAMGGDAIRVYALAVLAFDDLAGGRIEPAIELLDEAQELSDRLSMDEPALVSGRPTTSRPWPGPAAPIAPARRSPASSARPR